jgi:hypothetical protein
LAAATALPRINDPLAMMDDVFRKTAAKNARLRSAGLEYFWNVNIFCSSSTVLPRQDLHLENAGDFFPEACAPCALRVIANWE